MDEETRSELAKVYNQNSKLGIPADAGGWSKWRRWGIVCGMLVLVAAAGLNGRR